MKNIYYSLNRPLGPGTMPDNKRVMKVVNFDERRYCADIERRAWGYFEYYGELSDKDVSDYELMKKPPKFSRELMVGDEIVALGDKAFISKILSQEFYPEDEEIFIEFLDEKGNYRSWKSWIDGGTVNYWDKYDLYDSFSVGMIKRINGCLEELEKCGVDYENKVMYFMLKDTLDGKPIKYGLLDLYQSYGTVELNEDVPEDKVFKDMLISLKGNRGVVAFLMLPNSVIKSPKAFSKEHIPWPLIDMLAKDRYTVSANGLSESRAEETLSYYIKAKGYLRRVFMYLKDKYGENWAGVKEKDRVVLTEKESGKSVMIFVK